MTESLELSVCTWYLKMAFLASSKVLCLSNLSELWLSVMLETSLGLSWLDLLSLLLSLLESSGIS